MSFMGRWNAYLCEKCGKSTVTIDVDDGVTPFMMRCRASGRVGDCGGMSASRFYPRGNPPNEPTFEWYKPTTEELACLEPGEREHVAQGGLVLRRAGAGANAEFQQRAREILSGRPSEFATHELANILRDEHLRALEAAMVSHGNSITYRWDFHVVLMKRVNQLRKAAGR